MDLNISAFQEPRGVMKIFQFIFAICAFATTTNFGGMVDFLCDGKKMTFSYEYPFRLFFNKTFEECSSNEQVFIGGNFSSDSQFFVATGVLSMLFSLAIAIVYAKFDEKYKTNAQWPMVDFGITVFLAVLWLSSSAAWANGITGMKMTTSTAPKCKGCSVISSSLSSLYISVILGFLNFFLWASDLWFVYKETEWFQAKQQAAATSPTM